MRFAIIEPGKHNLRYWDGTDFDAAISEAGLRPGALDFGSVTTIGHTRRISIVVYEYGLCVDPSVLPYFALGRQLYAGNAVLFAANRQGDTIDMPVLDWPPIEHFDCAADIELAIAAGIVERPETRVNGVPMWRWPPAKWEAPR